MKQELGRVGENMAADHLEKQGYKILARNFRSPAGELDIVCCKNSTLVFVEVKTRRSEIFGTAEEAITAKKIEHIRKAALYYLNAQPTKYQEIRFDVITIVMTDSKQRLNHILAAF